MLSTQNLILLPDKQSLRKICKAIAVLDAIISQEWQYRYYSFNSKWTEGEEFFEMRNGQGDQMLILFREDGCVINGFAHEYRQPSKKHLTENMPLIFKEFIFGEPVKSVGTTFCLWTTESEKWQTGRSKSHKNNSEKMLAIFDGNPQTYLEWATGYFEGSYAENGIPLDTVKEIYSGDVLTKKMVLSLVDELEDWQMLQEDLMEIAYPYNFA